VSGRAADLRTRIPGRLRGGTWPARSVVALGALALLAAPGAAPGAAQEPSSAAEAPTRPPGAYRLTGPDLDQLRLPGDAPVWGIAFADTDTSGIAALFPEMLERMPDRLLDLVDMRFVDSASVVAAVDTLLGAGPLDSAGRTLAIDAFLEEASPDTVPRVLGDSLRARVRSFPPEDGDQGPALDGDLLDVLQEELQGVWFPDEHLFRTALRLVSHRAGYGLEERGMRRLVALARLARATPPDSLGLQPLAWTGAGCGCGVYVEGEVWEPEFYGMYPFWEAPQGEVDPVQPDTIDLSLLTRIGYYGLTFDRTGSIRDPRHWRKGRYPERARWWSRRDFSDFAAVAHDHKVNVDAVVYQRDWSWLPDALEDPDGGFGEVFATLRTEVVDLVSTPLDHFMDRVKPVVSLGQTRRRTLGDGVTIDFDVSELDAARQRQLFDRLQEVDFFRALHDSLKARADDGSPILDAELDYRLNLIVPLECMVSPPGRVEGEGCGFFSLAHLVELKRDSVDLFLVDMTAVTPGGPLEAISLDEQTRLLRASLDRLDPREQASLIPSILPLAAPGPGDSAEDFVLVSDVAFRGVGKWSITESSELDRPLESTFLAEPPRGPVLSLLMRLEESVCSRLCPIRWPIRLGILTTVLLYIAFWVATEYRYAWKSAYRSHAHLALVVVFVLAVIGTLWCDPYWKARQTLIVSGVALFALVVFGFIQARLRRELHYP
jgi:hypothetical protein